VGKGLERPSLNNHIMTIMAYRAICCREMEFRPETVMKVVPKPWRSEGVMMMGARRHGKVATSGSGPLACSEADCVQ
jgi:hypothetical protein